MELLELSTLTHNTSRKGPSPREVLGRQLWVLSPSWCTDQPISVYAVSDLYKGHIIFFGRKGKVTNQFFSIKWKELCARCHEKVCELCDLKEGQMKTRSLRAEKGT